MVMVFASMVMFRIMYVTVFGRFCLMKWLWLMEWLLFCLESYMSCLKTYLVMVNEIVMVFATMVFEVHFKFSKL